MRRPRARGPDDDNVDARDPARGRLRLMNAEQLQELRRIVRTDALQIHARDVLRERPPTDPFGLFQPAPPGDDLATRWELYMQLWGHADPLPSPLQVVEGIPHKNQWILKKRSFA